ncbi:MAG TPA: hypothetical protein VFG10_10470 [Saprospiraceae bacterium]|nr:hypothetical protein [Saprospiraceae bacterium]
MFRSILISLLLIGINLVLYAQPFDTLLVQYQNINQIYALDDGSFILIGHGEESIVERIDSIGTSIWSVSLGLNYDEDDILHDYAVHMLPEDSTIQIAVSRKYCDSYDTSDVKVYTLNFDGLVMDSLLVRAKDLPTRITLLSGNPRYPRLAYIRDSHVVLHYTGGDTVQLRMTIPGADSTINQFVGLPVCMALSPQGTLLVGTSLSSLMRFKDDGTGFHFFKNKFFTLSNTIHHQIRQLFSVDEEYYLLVYYDKIELRSFSNGLEKSFSSEYVFYPSIIISPPFLYVISENFISENFMSEDSFFIFDLFLNKIYNEPIPDYEQRIDGFAIRNRTLFTVGSGYSYYEGGFLGSENLDTYIGPKLYDIELVDFEVGPYDSVFLQYGFRYVYSIPNASVTVKNNSDFTINQMQVLYTYPFSFCSDGSWTKEIRQMELLPGETKTYDLHDIIIVKKYPFSGWYGACITVLRPDDHADDNFSDNEICKKVELIPASLALPEFPIQHSPPIIADQIMFFAPQAFDFDLTIYNYSGIEVFNAHANTSTGYSVDLNFLPSGIYIFQYFLPDQQKRYVEKIFKW